MFRSANVAATLFLPLAAAFAAPAQGIQLLDAFQQCDRNAIKAVKLPAALPGGLHVIEAKSLPFGDGDRGMELVFSGRTPGLAQRLKRDTGYDFTSRVYPPKPGLIGFDSDETGDRDNYLVCYRRRK